ncbi:MAG TPA: hypothetical protein VGF69_17755 [Thermoanaerobaculia bacterium]|jgi:hypothetical protein
MAVVSDPWSVVGGHRDTCDAMPVFGFWFLVVGEESCAPAYQKPKTNNQQPAGGRQ